MAGPAGATYREEFTWTLTPSSAGFSQISYYFYQEGANQGNGGLCGGSARRTP